MMNIEPKPPYWEMNRKVYRELAREIRFQRDLILNGNASLIDRPRNASEVRMIPDTFMGKPVVYSEAETESGDVQ